MLRKLLVTIAVLLLKFFFATSFCSYVKKAQPTVVPLKYAFRDHQHESIEAVLLGGGQARIDTQHKRGVAHNAYENDVVALRGMRENFDYLFLNNKDTPEPRPTQDTRHRVEPSLSLDKDCRLLIETIDRLCSIPASDGGFTSTIMTSEKGRDAIKALTQPDQSSILNVPVDQRSFCKSMLERSIDKPGMNGRRDLLCSVAMPGSGKTVVLWFNLHWFVDKTKGIAVEVTFNDEQSGLYPEIDVRSKKQLKLAIAVRIIHRLLLKFPKADCKADLKCKARGSVVNALLKLKDPLDSTLKVVRFLLGAPSDTKVLLCVDELSKSVDSDSKDFTTEDALRVLTQRLDSDENFYLSVSALCAEDVVRLSTGSNRHLMLQALGPLWYTEGFNPKMIHLLPDALRPFYQEDARVCLPYNNSNMELYDELSQLLTTAAGHPRRMEFLFHELGEFQASDAARAVFGRDTGMSPSKRKAAGKFFVDELAKWLHHIDDRSKRTKIYDIALIVEKIVNLPTNYALLPRDYPSVEDKDKIVGSAIEDLATYCAQPFTMPNTPKTKKLFEVIFSGVAEGFCQLVSMDGTHDGQLLAFIPMPVLEGDRPDHLLPRGEALFKLHDAILDMYKSKHNEQQKGKDLEEVAVASFLLMSRCRNSFTLSQLCEPGSCGADLDVKMKGGPGVMLTTMYQFPKSQGEVDPAGDVQALVDELKSSDAPGMIIKVENPQNVPGDFYGIFKTTAGGFAGFRVQCKDWFFDSSRKTQITDKWREYDRRIPAKIKLEDGTIVPFASLLFASNKLQKEVPLQSFEGVITFAAMRTWLPTAAHALQTFAHHREIFGWHKTTSVGQSRKIWTSKNRNKIH